MPDNAHFYSQRHHTLYPYRSSSAYYRSNRQANCKQVFSHYPQNIRTVLENIDGWWDQFCSILPPSLYRLRRLDKGRGRWPRLRVLGLNGISRASIIRIVGFFILWTLGFRSLTRSRRIGEGKFLFRSCNRVTPRVGTSHLIVSGLLASP